jgi:hypothetical protein
MYEVKGVSHFGGEHFSEKDLAPRGIGEDENIVLLDLLRLMDYLIDLLDNWVEKDSASPVSKSDWLELGNVDSDRVNEDEAIALPEVPVLSECIIVFPQAWESVVVNSQALPPLTSEP